MQNKKRNYVGHTFSKNMPLRSGALKPMKGMKPLKPWAFAKQNPHLPLNSIAFFDAAKIGERSLTNAILTRNDLNSGHSQVCPETKEKLSLPFGHKAEVVKVTYGKRVLGHSVVSAPKFAA